MDGYDKLTFIDKIRFKLRVRKQEKIEDKRQSIEHDDRIPVEKRYKLEQEITNNPKLSQDLASLRYNPEESRKQTGEVVACQAVYSKMTEEAKNNEYNNKSKTSNELEER